MCLHASSTSFFFITMPYYLLLLFTLLLCSCHNDAPTPGPVEPGSVTARRTVLVYMSAQNSLINNVAADSAEIMNGRQYLANNDRMLFFIDDGQKPRLYRVARQWSQPQLVQQWSHDFCSTDPNTLQSVLQWVKTQFPAQEYGLVMWSHADGWLPATNTDYPIKEMTYAAARPFSFGIDTDNNSVWTDDGTQMNVADMAQAIAQSGMHCRYILFDACLMQNLEVAYALRHATDYVVASPMSINSAGAYYTHLLRSGLFAQSPDSIALTYYNDVVNYADSIYDHMGIAISCIQTDQLEPLAALMKQALPHSLLANGQSADMTQVLSYQNYTYRFYWRPHNYDARQAINTLFAEPYRTQLQQALDRVVVAHFGTPSIYVGPGYNTFFTIPTTTDNFRSVSMFVPQSIYTNNAERCRYGDLNLCFRQTEWYKACGFDAVGW